MKLSLVVLLFALFTTTMARSTLLDLFSRDEGPKDGEQSVGEGEGEGIELKGDKEKEDNHIAVCVLEFMMNVDNVIKGKGGDDGHENGGNGGDDGPEKGGNGGGDDDDDDDDDKKLVAKLGETLITRMLRIKRRAQEEPLPTNVPSRHPSHIPSDHPSRGPRKCREGVLERFFNCLGNLGDDGEHGKPPRTTAAPEIKRHLNKRKFHKSVA